MRLWLQSVKLNDLMSNLLAAFTNLFEMNKATGFVIFQVTTFSILFTIAQQILYHCGSLVKGFAHHFQSHLLLTFQSVLYHMIFVKCFFFLRTRTIIVLYYYNPFFYAFWLIFLGVFVARLLKLRLLFVAVIWPQLLPWHYKQTNIVFMLSLFA